MDPLTEAGVAVGKELITKTTFYDDGLRPVVTEAGKALGTLGKTVNLCLAPLAGVVWGYEKICAYVEKRVTEKLQSNLQNKSRRQKQTLPCQQLKASGLYATNPFSESCMQVFWPPL